MFSCRKFVGFIPFCSLIYLGIAPFVYHVVLVKEDRQPVAKSQISFHYVGPRSNSGCQAWWQALLPTEPSYWLFGRPTTLNISESRCINIPNLALIFNSMIFFLFIFCNTVAQTILELIVWLRPVSNLMPSFLPQC